MVLDSLEQADRYRTLHDGLGAAFDFLRSTDPSSLPTGRCAIDGERLFAVVGRETGQGRDRRRLEFHRRYIDVQYVVDGEDEIGWLPLARCRRPAEPYDAERDVGFFADRPESYFRLRKGQFALFFPDDAHAPLSGCEPMIKIVVKLAVGGR